MPNGLDIAIGNITNNTTKARNVDYVTKLHHPSFLSNAQKEDYLVLPIKSYSIISSFSLTIEGGNDMC